MQQHLRKIPAYGVIALLAYMPFHVFLSQSLSLLTGGLPEWKLAKDVVLVVLTLFTICLVWRQGRVSKWYVWLVGFTAAYGLLHLVLWAVHPDIYRNSALLGITYNVRIPCFVVAGAGAALLYPKAFAFRSIIKIVLIISTVVAALGVLQYFLPKDILAHFGYSLDRGVRPNFFIDDNPAFPRVMSTLRDPNSLGAYLLVPLAALIGMVLRMRKTDLVRQMFVPLSLLLHLAAIYLTFSRSAWVGAALVVGLTIWWRFSSQFVRLLKIWWPATVVAVVVLAGAVYWQRHNSALDGIVTHSTNKQVGPYDSNQYHWMFVRAGLLGIWHEPLGHGPGTAGLASIQNPRGSNLTENYYVQVGYEVGVVGLVMFVGLNAWLYIRIWRRHDGWTEVLLPAFWAYVLMNMLLHTWSNEAVAAQWWLLAGLALVCGPSYLVRGGADEALSATKAKAFRIAKP